LVELNRCLEQMNKTQFNEITMELIVMISGKELVNDSRESLLINFICLGMEQHALALLATGKSQPYFQNKYGNTALILACYFKMETVAMAILTTGQSNYLAKDNAKQDALFYAKRGGLAEVCQKIEELTNPNPQSTHVSVSIPTLDTITFKCVYCQNALTFLQKTHALVPCGHTNFHLDCFLKNIWNKPEKKCQACQKDIITFITLQ